MSQISLTSPAVAQSPLFGMRIRRPSSVKTTVGPVEVKLDATGDKRSLEVSTGLGKIVDKLTEKKSAAEIRALAAKIEAHSADQTQEQAEAVLGSFIGAAGVASLKKLLGGDASPVTELADRINAVGDAVEQQLGATAGALVKGVSGQLGGLAMSAQIMLPMLTRQAAAFLAKPVAHVSAEAEQELEKLDAKAALIKAIVAQVNGASEKIQTLLTPAADAKNPFGALFSILGDLEGALNQAAQPSDATDGGSSTDRLAHVLGHVDHGKLDLKGALKALGLEDVAAAPHVEDAVVPLSDAAATTDGKTDDGDTSQS